MPIREREIPVDTPSLRISANQVAAEIQKELTLYPSPLDGNGRMRPDLVKTFAAHMFHEVGTAPAPLWRIAKTYDVFRGVAEVWVKSGVALGFIRKTSQGYRTLIEGRHIPGVISLDSEFARDYDPWEDRRWDDRIYGYYNAFPFMVIDRYYAIDAAEKPSEVHHDWERPFARQLVTPWTVPYAHTALAPLFAARKGEWPREVYDDIVAKLRVKPRPGTPAPYVLKRISEGEAEARDAYGSPEHTAYLVSDIPEQKGATVRGRARILARHKPADADDARASDGSGRTPRRPTHQGFVGRPDHLEARPLPSRPKPRRPDRG